MNDREQFILRAALIYLQANRDDVNDAFETDRLMPPGQREISVMGEVEQAIKEDEIERLLTTLRQGAVNFVF